jgi:nitronate monooxygenase
MDFGGEGAKKARKDIWGSVQVIGAVTEVLPAAELVERLVREYDAAKARLLAQASRNPSVLEFAP